MAELGECMDRAELRTKLLAEAAKKPVRLFVQFDGFGPECRGDYVIDPDGDGLGLMTGTTYELRNLDNPLRLLINPDADRDTLLGLLKGATEWIKRHWKRMAQEAKRKDAVCPEYGRPFPASLTELPF